MMKQNGSHNFQCANDLQAASICRRSPAADGDDTSVSPCHSGAKELPLALRSAAQEMHVAQGPAPRRQFLRNAALGLGAGIIGVLGFRGILDSKPVESVVLRDALAQHTFSFKVLDQRYSAQGRKGVTPLVHSKNESDTATLVNWIADRRLAALYDILAQCVVDSREEVAYASMLALQQVPPVDLKPFLLDLQGAAAQAGIPAIAARLEVLIAKVETP